MISLPKLPRILIGACWRQPPRNTKTKSTKKPKLFGFLGVEKPRLFGFWWVEKPNGLVFRGSKNQNGLVFGRSKNQNGLGSWRGGSQAPGVCCAFAVVSSVACNVWHERASLRMGVGWPWVGGLGIWRRPMSFWNVYVRLVIFWGSFRDRFLFFGFYVYISFSHHSFTYLWQH